MSCKYAWDNGYQTALNRVRDRLNQKMDAATRAKNDTNSRKQEWWRHTGRQDLILEFFDDLCELIHEKEDAS